MIFSTTRFGRIARVVLFLVLLIALTVVSIHGVVALGVSPMHAAANTFAPASSTDPPVA